MVPEAEALANAKKFRRPSKIEFEPRLQEEVRSDTIRPEAEPDEPLVITRAEQIVIQYDKTIEFFRWLESLLDNRFKDIAVTIDQEDQPEVWLAMQRVFSNPNARLDYGSYIQVLDAIEEMNQLEAEAAQPAMSTLDEFIAALPEQGKTVSDKTTEMSIPTEDERALEDALRQQIFQTEGVITQIREAAAERLRSTIEYLEQRSRWVAARLERLRQRFAATADRRVREVESTVRYKRYKRQLDQLTAQIEQANELLTATLAGERDDALLGR
jgi:hypothetical protein